MSAEAAWEAPYEERSGFAHAYTDVERLFVMSRPSDYDHPSTLRFRGLVENFRRQLEKLNDPTLPADSDVIEIPTAATAKGMQEIFERYQPTSYDVIAIIGGDGTKSNAHAGALLAGFEGIIQSVAGGNADDQTHMLFKRRDITDPAGAMPRSRRADLHLLEITSDQPNIAGENTVYSTGYISFGDLVHDVAADVSDPSFRAQTEYLDEFRKFAAETNLMLGKIGAGGLISIEDESGRRTRSDLLLTNGQRMAKSIRFAGVNLLRPGYGRVELKRSSIPRIVTGLGRAATGLFTHLEPEDTYSFTITRQDEGPIRGQNDGELFLYPSGTTFTARVHEKPLHVATTKKA